MSEVKGIGLNDGVGRGLDVPVEEPGDLEDFRRALSFQVFIHFLGFMEGKAFLQVVVADRCDHHDGNREGGDFYFRVSQC